MDVDVNLFVIIAKIEPRQNLCHICTVSDLKFFEKRKSQEVQIEKLVQALGTTTARTPQLDFI